MEINIKHRKGKYICYATINGYDYSETSSNLEQAKSDMLKHINKSQHKNVQWGNIQFIVPEKIKPHNIIIPRLDYL